MFDVRIEKQVVDNSTEPRKIMHLFGGLGRRRPVAGDKALCGKIKDSRTRFATSVEAKAALELDPCIVCYSLDGRINV